MPKEIVIVKKVLHKVNVPRIICDHLLGDNHSNKHRMAVGGIVMVSGVYLAKVVGHSHYIVIEIGADLFGYLVHGIGAVPYVDALVSKVKTEE